jgi:hypothetical protein
MTLICVFRYRSFAGWERAHAGIIGIATLVVAVVGVILQFMTYRREKR